MYASSELYATNAAPSLEVLRDSAATLLKDLENRSYWQADEDSEFVRSRMDRLTINRYTDTLFWCRHNPHDNKGTMIDPWPQVNRVQAKEFVNQTTGGSVYFYIIENSDGQIERGPNKRNTGYVILRAV